MDWHESDHSDDGDNQDSQAASRKRSSRACDQCRKTKSKCERGANEGVPCKSCALSGTACTFLGPSYKRGPPKGYIRAIEQRWHQVESLLGVILQCPDPRVRSVVSDLRQDELAREILQRVDTGPYGPSGRRFQSQGATKEDFFASVLRSNGSIPGREQSRNRRQSRVSREKVSSTQDRGLSIVPTQEWQDNLSSRLASSSSAASSPYSTCSTPSGGPATQRRRVDAVSPVEWNDMYTMEATSDSDDHDSIKDPTESMGELSLTDYQEIRYHGKASGLHLLSKDNRTDERNEGGIWMLPMARVWPPSKDYVAQVAKEEDYEVVLPPVQMQDHLIDLYFTYIHPVFPVIHKSCFLSEYHARKQGKRDEEPIPTTYSSPKPESSQKASTLLLLSMFAITARFVDNIEPLPPKGKMWEAGCQYFDNARLILTKIFDRSRPCTVQSLLLLGYREFGLGSMEQGWIYIGMAIRMAMDLGLNCNSDHWKQHGHDLFARDETQTRRQIWWMCCLADRYGSLYMGRPIIIREEDYDTPFPELGEDDDEPWGPLQSDSINVSYPRVPGKIMLAFHGTASLCTILGDIITKVYPVRSQHKVSRRSLYAELETRLDQWYLSLPEALQFDLNSKRRVPPPHVLFVHIRYWGAVLLLNRAFIPNWRGAHSPSANGDFVSTSRKSTFELKAFDLSQGAASRISGIVNAWRETFTLRRASPFLTAYMLATGIMHILTLTLRPSNVQASQGLRQVMTALKDMAVLWPSASRALDLISGVRLTYETTQMNVSTGERIKRQADDAFGQEKSSDYLQRETFGPSHDGNPPQVIQHQATEAGVQDLSTRIMAHMLGLDIPGVEPSTSYYPGYEWWPRPGEGQQQQQQHVSQGMPQQMPSFVPNVNSYSRSNVPNIQGYPPPGVTHRTGGEEWLQQIQAPATVPDYSYNYQFGV
ncbi:hypothetical protein WG66_015820 [Moniliophthora roreri]|nr:hypothetical protein WG66_015820 [Moniliophthora roreri]